MDNGCNMLCRIAESTTRPLGPSGPIFSCYILIIYRHVRGGREDGDRSATYSDIEDDVYQSQRDIRIGPTDDVDSGK